MINGLMQGTRLAYVVRSLEGKVKRTRHVVKTFKAKTAKGVDRHEMTTEQYEEPAGFMVYFPRGHALRMKDERTLKHYGLDGEPPLVNLADMHDPNSPMGKLFRAQDEQARKSAFTDLEQQVVELVHHKAGKTLLSMEA